MLPVRGGLPDRRRSYPLQKKHLWQCSIPRDLSGPRMTDSIQFHLPLDAPVDGTSAPHSVPRTYAGVSDRSSGPLDLRAQAGGNCARKTDTPLRLRNSSRTPPATVVASRFFRLPVALSTINARKLREHTDDQPPVAPPCNFSASPSSGVQTPNPRIGISRPLFK